TSLKPNNELNKFIEAIISSDLEQLPENEPLRSWHINTDTIPPIVLEHFLSEFKQLRIINDKYRFILPDDAKICTCATLSRHLGNEENCKPDRTVRLKLENNQFKILYVEGANPELKGRKHQEDAEKL
ncbi:10955_t:CDS:2, partial [Racocetra persica]